MRLYSLDLGLIKKMMEANQLTSGLGEFLDPRALSCHDKNWNRRLQSDRSEKTELLESSHTIVQTDFLCDFAVFDAKYGCSSEAHFPACSRRQ